MIDIPIRPLMAFCIMLIVGNAFAAPKSAEDCWTAKSACDARCLEHYKDKGPAAFEACSTRTCLKHLNECLKQFGQGP